MLDGDHHSEFQNALPKRSTPPSRLGLVECVACVIAIYHLASGVLNAGEIAAEIGRRETIFPAGHAGLEAFSDQPIVVLGRNPFQYFVVAGDSTVAMRGRSLGDAVPMGVVLAPGKPGDFDDGYAGIGSTFKSRDGLVAFYHAEEHFGEAHNPKLRACNPTTNYWSIGLAVSKDGGRSFRKRGQVITSSSPRGTDPQTIQGVGDGYVCQDLTGDFLYLYYSDNTGVKDRSHTICIARCPVGDIAKPAAWKKLFNGEFTEPGLGGQDDAVVLPPVVPGAVGQAQVTYLKGMKKYFMLCVVVGAVEALVPQPAQTSGIYYAESDDGLRWNKPRPLLIAHTIPVVGREYTGHPYLYVEGETPDRVTGKMVYCFASSFGAGEGRTMHHLVCCPITITKLPAKERDNVAPSVLADRLKGTKWTRDGQPNNVFEWTNDGRLLQNGGNRKWTVLNDQSVEIRVPGKGGERVDRWVFADDLKTVVQHGDGGKWKSTWRQQGK